MTVNYEYLKLRIVSLRRSKKLSQDALANAAGISREYLALIETNKRRPSLDTVVKIANALNASADDLLVDSLKHPSAKTSKLSQMLLDCNSTEKALIIELVENLKAILFKLGI